MEFVTRSKIKNGQIKYQVFPKNGLRRIPFIFLDVLHIVYFIEMKG
jgi:hypothetical protein